MFSRQTNAAHLRMPQLTLLAEEESGEEDGSDNGEADGSDDSEELEVERESRLLDEKAALDRYTS